MLAFTLLPSLSSSYPSFSLCTKQAPSKCQNCLHVETPSSRTGPQKMFLKHHISAPICETLLKFMKELFDFVFSPLSGFNLDLVDLHPVRLRRPSVEALKCWHTDLSGCIIPSGATTGGLASGYTGDKTCDTGPCFARGNFSWSLGVGIQSVRKSGLFSLFFSWRSLSLSFHF